MALSDLPHHAVPVALLQRSLARGRLAHAYLMTGDSIEDLELFARQFTKTLNCERNQGKMSGAPDACDTCLSCQKVDRFNHADVRWIRPESKTRIISVEQIRDLLQSVYLKSTGSRHKVAILVGADRLNVQAANAFLKTLEEPPTRTVFMLLSTEPQRLLETILSRCLRLHSGGGTGMRVSADSVDWVASFAEVAKTPGAGLFARYRLLDQLLFRLTLLKAKVEASLSEQSPLEQYDDADPKLIERWKDELEASIEAEYRRKRGEILAALQLWLRDVWLTVQRAGDSGLASFPQLASNTAIIAARLDAAKATRNLEVIETTQRLLHTNVQEALALEIGLLRLSF